MAALGDENRAEAISKLTHKVVDHHIASESTREPTPPQREPTPPQHSSSPKPVREGISRESNVRKTDDEEADGLLDETDKEIVKEVEEGEIIQDPILHSTLRD